MMAATAGERATDERATTERLKATGGRAASRRRAATAQRRGGDEGERRTGNCRVCPHLGCPHRSLPPRRHTVKRRRRRGDDDATDTTTETRRWLRTALSYPKCLPRAGVTQSRVTEMLPPKRCHRNVAIEMLPPKYCRRNAASCLQRLQPPVSVSKPPVSRPASTSLNIQALQVRGASG